MNRRGFLQALGLGAAGLVLDPDLLLWKPGAKTIFLPPVGDFQPSVFIDCDWVTREGLRMLAHQLKMAQFFSRTYDREFTERFTLGPSIVRVNEPRRYLSPAMEQA